jgi:hypothetical protein
MVLNVQLSPNSGLGGCRAINNLCAFAQQPNLQLIDNLRCGTLPLSFYNYVLAREETRVIQLLEYSSIQRLENNLEVEWSNHRITIWKAVH